MRCPRCGHDGGTSALRCVSCGADIPDTETTADELRTELNRPDATLDDACPAPEPAVEAVAEAAAAPAPLVGRRAERAKVLDAWTACVRAGDLRAVVIRGAAGQGKTRLIEHCLGRMAQGGPPPAAVFRARPPAAGGDRASAFAALVRRHLDLPAAMSPDQGRRRLLELVRARLGDGGAAFDVASMLGRLLQLPFPGSGALHLTGDVLDRRMSRAISALVSAAAVNGPVVVWIDDVDRLGPADRKLLRGVTAALKGERVLVLVSGRDPREAPMPGADVVGIDLPPLDEAASRQMLSSLLSRCPEVPAELVKLMHGQARGNPRAIEAAVGLLLAQGVVDATGPAWRVDRERLGRGELPGDLGGLLRARIGELPRDDRRVMEAAAVQGREFDMEGVIACLMADEGPADDLWADDPRVRRVETALGRLLAGELIERGDGGGWRFRDDDASALVVDGLGQERLHFWRRVVAAWLETSGRDDGPERAADFWEAGGRPARAAAGRTAAGDRAAERFRSEEAIRHYTRALELLDDADFRARMDLRRALGDVRAAAGDAKGALAEFEAMLRDAAAARDRTGAALAFRRLGEVRGELGDWEQAQAALRRGRRLYEEAGDAIGVASCLEIMGRVALYRGSPRGMAEAQSNVERALRLRREVGDAVGVAQSYHYLGWIHADCGRDREAQAAYEAAIRLRRESEDRAGLVRSLNNLGDVHLQYGRWLKGREVLLESLKGCEEIGLAAVRPAILVNLARSHLDVGDVAEAAAWLDRAEQALEGVDDRLTWVDVHLLYSRVLQALGEQGQAQERVEAAGLLVEELEGTYQQGVVFRRMAELLSETLYDAERGDEASNRAGRLFLRSGAVLEAAGHDLELAKTLLAYSRYLVERGHTDEARQMRDRANALTGQGAA